jgi:DNA-binding NarL/FixJ family response regulator
VTARILIVDDTDHVRDMLVNILEIQGFEVVGQASSAEEALEQADEHRPDVVVMDYKMPGTDGLEATRGLRERHPDLSVILYSAYLTEELRKAAEEAGVLVCVPKTSGVEALGREIAAAALGLGGDD